jgi:hypothetical protein
MSKFEEEIRKNITDICEVNNLQRPLTVYGAGKILKEYLGLDKTIELYKGARDETKSDVFRTSAYEAVIDTLLKPKKKR